MAGCTAVGGAGVGVCVGTEKKRICHFSPAVCIAPAKRTGLTAGCTALAALVSEGVLAVANTEAHPASKRWNKRVRSTYS